MFILSKIDWTGFTVMEKNWSITLKKCNFQLYCLYPSFFFRRWMKQIPEYTMFCEGYLAMLELEEMNESYENSGEIYEWEFFCKHFYYWDQSKLKTNINTYFIDKYFLLISLARTANVCHHQNQLKFNMKRNLNILDWK